MKIDISKIMVEQQNGDIVHPVEVSASGNFVVLRLPERTAKSERTKPGYIMVRECTLEHVDSSTPALASYIGDVNCIMTLDGVTEWGWVGSDGLPDSHGYETDSKFCKLVYKGDE